MAKKKILSGLMCLFLTTPLLQVKTTQINSKPKRNIECVEKVNLRTYEINQVQEIIDSEIQKRKEIEKEEQKKQEEIEQQKINENRIYCKFEVSFYCGCYYCTQNGNLQTASGEYAIEGITIATPDDIPFGSEIHIEGMESKYIVQDRGGYIGYTYDEQGKLVMRLDVYIEDHNRALQYGRFYADGYIDIKN